MTSLKSTSDYNTPIPSPFTVPSSVIPQTEKPQYSYDVEDDLTVDCPPNCFDISRTVALEYHQGDPRYTAIMCARQLLKSEQTTVNRFAISKEFWAEFVLTNLRKVRSEYVHGGSYHQTVAYLIILVRENIDSLQK